MKTFSIYIINKLLECRKYIEYYERQPVVTHKKEPNSRIVAIGDIHGDIDLMISTLEIAGVIQQTQDPSEDHIELNIYKDNKDNIKYYKWIGGNTIVVQVGDQIDRCRTFYDKNTNISYICDNKTTVEGIPTTYDDEASDIEILLFFTNLHKLASKEIYGGAVYSLLGNHELMNSFGDIRYVSYENLEQVKLEQVNNKNLVVAKEIASEVGDDEGNEVANFENRRKHIFRREGILSKFLACTRSSILIVNRYLFVHGGVLGSFIYYLNDNDNNNDNDDDNKYAIFEIINDVIKQWLMFKNNEYLNTTLKTKYNNNNMYNNFFKNYNYNINHFIFASDSPFMTRILGEIKPNIKINDPLCNDVNVLTDKFKFKGIIVGHTPQSNGINGTCSNKLYRIDIASSKAFYHALKSNLLPAEVLEIGTNNQKKILY
jgi:hypothetical protein